MFYFSSNYVFIKSNQCPCVRVVASIGYSTPCDKLHHNHLALILMICNLAFKPI